MAKIDEQLVRQIADQVVAALRSRQGGSIPAEAAPIRPPAGVCTGDYSQFAELREREPAPEQTGRHPQTAPALTGIITAEQLQKAMKASADGIATLAPDARLTPLAQDLAREQAEKIRRAEVPGTGHSAAVTERPWLWWADGFCPAVQEMTGEMRGRVEAMSAERSARGLLRVLGELNRRVQEGRVSGGLLFVQSSVLAACYANRCRALRAVVGMSEEAVERGVRELGANVLIVEYPRVSPQAMRQMVQRMVQSDPKAPGPLQRDLRELEEGC